MSCPEFIFILLSVSSLFWRLHVSFAQFITFLSTKLGIQLLNLEKQQPAILLIEQYQIAVMCKHGVLVILVSILLN